METTPEAEDMGRTTIQVSDELADVLHDMKQRGDSYEDVIRRALEVPNEYRIDCGECGFDGGTYDFHADPDPPSHCPKCGKTASDNEKVRIIPAEDEPTALSWRSFQFDDQR